MSAASAAETVARCSLVHLLEDPLDPLQPGVERGQEVGLLVFDHAGHGRHGLAKLGIRMLHQFGHAADQLVQERLADAHLVAVQHRPAQQPADHVALLLVAGIDVLVDGEGAGADVVGDAAQAAAVLVGRIVADAADLARRLDQRPEDVDVEVGLDALQHGGRPLQAHARVDVLARQRAAGCRAGRRRG